MRIFYTFNLFFTAGLMESVSLELKSSHKSINTTVVCPTVVKTPMVDFDFTVRYMMYLLVMCV